MSHTPSASAQANPSLASPTACPPTPAGQLSEGAPAVAGPDRPEGDPRVARRGDDAEGRLAVCERAFAFDAGRDAWRGRLDRGQPHVRVLPAFGWERPIEVRAAQRVVGVAEAAVARVGAHRSGGRALVAGDLGWVGQGVVLTR